MARQKNEVGFQVCAKRCDECLFTPAKVVDEARKKQLIETCVADGSFFVCHKGSLTGNHQLCCRGFFDEVETLTTVLAKAWEMVRFVEVPKL